MCSTIKLRIFTRPDLRHAWACAAFLTLLPSLAHAANLTVPAPHALIQSATRTVPAQYATIQAAVNASASGDTVVVADGTYSGPGNRDIDFGGKNITVTSVHGAASTIIDCGGFASADGSGNHRGFYIHSGETAAVISGFTVKNGYKFYLPGIVDSDSGGGICIDNNSATVQNCIVTGNSADYGGGVSNSNDTGASSRNHYAQ